MIVMADAGTHQGLANSNRKVAPIDIVAVAIHLDPRRTTPPWRQSRMGGPMRGWFSIQWASRGELRAAAQAASSTKGTVGITGTNAPMIPKARLVTASALSSQRTGLDSGRGVFGGESSGGTVISRLCRPPLCLRP